ncbi:sigma-70 family RNA polymerase sigma factor [Mucilaginibacter ginsenosidivorax]|uniref:Sigma-70 family RNA polymerase sigma factor n=1 Tax=Mucilaginibacter ginsenosidivorax TaxID=862126 RepID=A0A5B8W9I7_9SPHI|nr:sigma-70 family RNA polymerase sigma factor [Mucilaginibacter ginsenosidivorax]QEC79646.1 sigma-70 family RNA polymerase sigma factor [Mucilaginibacter ginsenosidivorax]
MFNYGTYTDEQLTALLKEGDHAAYTEIYRRYWKKLLLIAWNHSKDQLAAKDIVHDVFISLWERYTDVEINNLSAFLATSVKFTVYKYYQKEQRRNDLALQNYEYETIVNDEDKLDAIFLQEYVNGIVEKMPEKCRLVFGYSRNLGMKNSEIATKIQITEKGVEANLTRALRIIRGELKNHGWILIIAIHIHRLFK